MQHSAQLEMPPGSVDEQDLSALPASNVLRKKLYGQNLADWTARYRKNKQNLDSLAKDCDALRAEVSKSQQEVDERADGLRQLEERFANDILARHNDTKSQYALATQQKEALQAQLSENRKQKAQLQREKKTLSADYERKLAELIGMAEARDRFEMQFSQLQQQLQQMGQDRKKMERELDLVQHNLRANTELADEVHSEIEHVFDGIKDSMGMHMIPATRSDGSIAKGLDLDHRESEPQPDRHALSSPRRTGALGHGQLSSRSVSGGT